MIRLTWRPKYLGIDEIPNYIHQCSKYADRDWWLDKARLTDDGRYVGLWFDDGTFHLWRCSQPYNCALRITAPWVLCSEEVVHK